MPTTDPSPQPSSVFPRLETFVRQTPLLAVAEAREGPLAVEGQALPKATMSSPISPVTVIGYRIVLEGETAGGRRHFFDLGRCHDFVVGDASGRLEVTASAHATLLFAHEYSGDSAEVSSGVSFDVERMMAADPLWQELRPVRFRWYEYLLQPGEPVFVAGEYGLLRDRSAAPLGYRAAAHPTLRGSAEQPLLVTDRTRAQLLSDLTALPPGG